jgi:hypothetical protein
MPTHLRDSRGRTLVDAAAHDAEQRQLEIIRLERARERWMIAQRRLGWLLLLFTLPTVRCAVVFGWAWGLPWVLGALACGGMAMMQRNLIARMDERA